MADDGAQQVTKRPARLEIADRPDLIIHLGDYIYESSWGKEHVRKHDRANEAVTLDDGPLIRQLNDFAISPDGARVVSGEVAWSVTSQSKGTAAAKWSDQ